jgi:hypothetical protein
VSSSVYILKPSQTDPPAGLYLVKDTTSLLLTDTDGPDILLHKGTDCRALAVLNGGGGNLVVARGAGPQGPAGPAGRWAPEAQFLLTAPEIAAGSVTLPDTPATDSLFVFLNGLYLSEGVGCDYTLSGQVITWNPSYTLYAGSDLLTARYQYNT